MILAISGLYLHGCLHLLKVALDKGLNMHKIYVTGQINPHREGCLGHRVDAPMLRFQTPLLCQAIHAATHTKIPASTLLQV